MRIDPVMISNPSKNGQFDKEQKVFNSVGIDIGSTTTQLVFSKLTLDFMEEKHKFDIVEREITYLSDIYFTPFNKGEINVSELSKILSSIYDKAGYTSNLIDTGAIIITGVAALRKNAEMITDIFSDQMGNFVCATAGPNYEAVLAAHGSGAVDISDRYFETVMNVDVGGGTTKIAIIENGKIIDTASIYVGSRHIAFDKKDHIMRIEKPAKIISDTLGLNLKLGAKFKEKVLFTSTLSDCLFQVIERNKLSKLTEELMLTDPLSYQGEIEYICFSGGVSEYIYDRENMSYGDLGLLLGKKIRKDLTVLDFNLIEPSQRIRATVIGESQYTLQVSGTTTLVSDYNLLPLKNIPVIAPEFVSNILSQKEIEKKLERAIEMRDLLYSKSPFALAFRRSLINQPSYQLMKKLSSSVVSVMEERIESGVPVILIFEADIGMGIGRVITEELSADCKLISIDEIKVNNFNYIDIGEPKEQKSLIPVIIKSLVFPKQL